MSTQDDSNDDAPMFSRASVNGPFGNLEHRISTDVDGETFLMFTQMVREAGTDRAGAVRDWVYMIARGQTYTDFMRHAEKVNRDKLFGTGPMQVLKGTDKDQGGAA